MLKGKGIDEQAALPRQGSSATTAAADRTEPKTKPSCKFTLSPLSALCSERDKDLQPQPHRLKWTQL
jgi:hypothetical protein